MTHFLLLCRPLVLQSTCDMVCQRLSKKYRKVLDLKKKCSSQELNVEQKELLSKLPYIEYALLEAEAFLKMVEHVAEEQNATNEIVSSSNQQPLAETETENKEVVVPELSPAPTPSTKDQGISKVNAGCQAVPVMINRYTWTNKKKKKDIGTNTVQLQTAEGSNIPRDNVRKALHKLLSMLQLSIRGGLSSSSTSSFSSTTTNLCEILLGRSFPLTPETMLSPSKSMKYLETGVNAALDYIFVDSLETEAVGIGTVCGEQEEKQYQSEDFVNMTISRDEMVVDQAQQINENGGVMKTGETEMGMLTQKHIGHTSPAAAEALLKGVLSGSGADHISRGGELEVSKVENFATTPFTSGSVINADSTPPALALALETPPPAPSLYIMPNADLLQPSGMARWPEDMKLHHNIQSDSPDELLSTLSQHCQSNIQDPSPPSRREHLQDEKLTQTQPLPPPPGLASVSQVGEIWNSSTDPQRPPDWFDLLCMNPPEPPQHWTKDVSNLSLEELVIKDDKLEEEECDPMRGVLSTRKQKSGRYSGNRNRKKRIPKAADDHRGGCGDVQQQQFQQPHVVQKDWKQQQQPRKVSSTVPQELLNAKALSLRDSRKNATAADCNQNCNQGLHTTTATLHGGEYEDNNFDPAYRSKPSNHHHQGSRRKPEHAISVGNGKGSKQSKTTLASHPPLSSNSGFGVGSTGKVEAQCTTARGKPYRKREEISPRWTSVPVV